jgi:hypothetical protein
MHESLEIVWIDPIIHEKLPINDAFQGRNRHVVSHCPKQRARENLTYDQGFRPMHLVRLCNESHARLLLEAT